MTGTKVDTLALHDINLAGSDLTVTKTLVTASLHHTVSGVYIYTDRSRNH